MKRSVLTTLKLFLVGGLMVIFSFPSFSQVDAKKKLQENKKQLEQEIQYYNKLLNDTKKNKQTSLQQLIILKNKIAKREELIRNINDELNVLEGDIINTQNEILSLNSEIKTLKDEYARIIRASYRSRSPQSRMIYIFASKNLNQAYHRIKYLQQYSAYRKQQVQLIQNKQTELTGKKNELEGHKVDKTNLLRSSESEKSQLTREQDEQKQEVTKLQKTEKELRATLQRKQQESRKLQTQIENIIAEEMRKAREEVKRREKAKREEVRREEAKREEERRKKKETTSTKQTTTKPNEKTTPHEKTTGTTSSKTTTPESVKEPALSPDALSLTPEDIKLTKSFAGNMGRLPWPCERGMISSGFGPHEHPLFKGVIINNNGVSILTHQGAAVRAVFDGEVTATFTAPNGFKAVIIRHGDYLTVYTNLASVSVRKDQKVSTKQTIGTVATDADENKTELQFQVWKGNKILNPSLWISKGSKN